MMRCVPLRICLKSLLAFVCYLSSNAGPCCQRTRCTRSHCMARFVDDPLSFVRSRFLGWLVARNVDAPSREKGSIVVTVHNAWWLIGHLPQRHACNVDATLGVGPWAVKSSWWSSHLLHVLQMMPDTSQSGLSRFWHGYTAPAHVGAKHQLLWVFVLFTVERFRGIHESELAACWDGRRVLTDN